MDSDPAFEQLFRVEFPSVVRTVFLICRDAQQAQDLTQEAFLQLLRHWNRVQRFDRPGAWVRRVAIRLAVRSVRTEHRRRQLELETRPDPGVAETDLDVLEAIHRLPGRQRTAVVLYYFQEWTVAEIADVLGCSESTARVHLHRARQALSRVLGAEAEVTHGD